MINILSDILNLYNDFIPLAFFDLDIVHVNGNVHSEPLDLVIKKLNL